MAPKYFIDIIIYMEINNNGYIVLKNVLNQNELNYALTCTQPNNKIHYKIMKNFIDTSFLPAIKQNVPFITNPKYIKFRYSNNNNSVDASTFHGDTYNHSTLEILPIFTCLCYFDDATLEIIPGSHKKSNKKWSIESYNNKQLVHVNRGDILVFHSNIHHRGVNFNHSENRRVLQVFDVFPNDEIYNDHIHNLILVTTSVSPSMQVFNKISLFLSNSTTVINIITFFHYIIMYNDLQYKIVFMDLAPWEKTDKYISYEPAHRIHYNDIDTEEDININIICNKHTSAKPGSFYAYFYIVYWILSTILIYFIYKMYAKSSISKSNINKNIRPVRNVRRR